jgi:sugar transferase (PEP-CTERM/EpsH1 system associated)
VKKILFLSHRIPFPPNKGDKIRSFAEIRHLSRKHEIHLLAFCDDPEDLQHAGALEEYCKTTTLIPLSKWKQSLRAGFAMIYGKPWSLGYFYCPQMKRAFSELIARFSFDLIFVYCSSVAGYATSAKCPKILDFVDADSLKWKQYSDFHRPPKSWLYSYEARKLYDFELEMMETFDRTLFVSPSEIANRSTTGLTDKIYFMQNGIDLEYFKPPSALAASPAIAFTGAMDYYPNIDAALFFAREIFPIIRSIKPDARFLIIGSRPTEEVRKLAAIPGITVTGTVKDVRPFLAECQAAVVPLRIAQGIQNKILEALAFGLPVIATPVAAGTLASAKELPIAATADPGEFARYVLRFLQEYPITPDKIDASRKYLSMHYDWETNLAILDGLIEHIVR